MRALRLLKNDMELNALCTGMKISHVIGTSSRVFAVPVCVVPMDFVIYDLGERDFV